MIGVNKKLPPKEMHQRLLCVLLITVILFASASAISLVKTMIFDGEEYQKKATEQQLYDTRITAERGNIYDAKMNVLATSAPVWTVFVTPNEISAIKNEQKKNQVKEALTKGLSEILELKAEDVESAINKTSQYYVAIKKKIEKDTADKVRKFISDNKELGLSSYIGLDEATKRYYSNDNLASTVLGFVGDDNQGLGGLELQYDEELTGTPGRIVPAKNALGKEMPFTYEKKVDAAAGNSLVTTIDSYIQYVTEKYLSAAVKINKVSERGAAIVMNVNSGEILAMATKGDFNPNSPFTLSAEDQQAVDALQGDERKTKLAELRNRQWRNKIVSDAYEPGSVFKAITASIGLEEGLTNVNSTFTCTGNIYVAGQKYSCHKKSGHGHQDLALATANSCNPFFISLGQTIGVSTFSKYFSAFGLTKKTGIDLPGEATSQYHKESNMGPTELASSSFGQTFKITPIQLITALSATVNGGNLIKPHVVKKIIDENGNVVKNYETTVVRQVISTSTSSTVRTLLEGVVDGGGGKNAYVSGYRIGGKTGTSQKVNEMLLSGKSGLYVASFAGFAPIDNPEIAVLVILDEPHGDNYYGGTIAAPVGGQILSDILPYLGYEPKYSEKEKANLTIPVPNVQGKKIAEAKSAITESGLKCRVVGTGETVLKQLPASTQSINKNGIVIIYTDETPENTKATVPNLTGMSPSEVNATATNAGLNVSFKGNTSGKTAVVSYSQSIEQGKEVEQGSVIEVFFRSFETGDTTILD